MFVKQFIVSLSTSSLAENCFPERCLSAFGTVERVLSMHPSSWCEMFFQQYGSCIIIKNLYIWDCHSNIFLWITPAVYIMLQYWFLMCKWNEPTTVLFCPITFLSRFCLEHFFSWRSWMFPYYWVSFSFWYLW